MNVFIFIFILAFSITCAMADIGSVLKVLGDKDAYLVRDGQKILLQIDQDLELDDEIHSQNSVLLLQIDPSTQISVSKNSHLKLSEHEIKDFQNIEKTNSVIEFIKGLIRVNVDRGADQEIDQKIKTRDVVFGVRGTDFEVSIDDSEDVDLDVFEGEVEASSPYIQSFVPEIIKKNEGFRFQKLKRRFLRRQFAPRFKNHPGFENKLRIRSKWKNKKLKNKNLSRVGDKLKSRKNRKR